MGDPPSQPRDESARLSYLRACAVLDTPPEPVFDNITALATSIFDVPTALVTLIDEGRQWFKSRIGFDLPETPRDIAFCAHTVDSGEALVVPDATADPRFANNPLVTGGPRVRFYAGAPLVAESGYVLGSVAILDARPRQLDAGKLEVLRKLASQVMSVLELRKTLHEQQRHLVTLADAALRETEASYQAMVEASTDLICQFDAEGRLSFVNAACCRMFGRRREALLGRSFTELIPAADLPAAEALVQSLSPHMTPRTITHRVEVPSGGERWCQTTAVAVSNTRGEFVAYQAVSTDITQQRELEAQVRQTQKLETVGQLAAGTAHDFNNLLTVIQGNAALLADQPPTPGVAELAQQITAAAERGTSLTRKLLLFSRKEQLQQAPVRLAAELRELAAMLARLIGEQVELDLRVEEDLPEVFIDASMIQHVIINLALNARDAMPRGGKLLITGERQDLSEARAAELSADARAGTFVRVAVSDTGMGIDPEILPRIFEPFFTTKERGRGTGLGLATAYGIILQHRGWIDVDSKPGHGTTIAIYLPMATTPVTAQPESRGTPAAHGHETVLVVEDEQGLLDLVVRVLSGRGYTVITATDAAEGLRTWQKHQGDVQLLLTDDVLPGPMRGHELAEACRQNDPGLRVIVMSGYAPEDLGVGPHAGGHYRQLPKPFRPAELLGLIRDLLDEPDDARDRL